MENPNRRQPRDPDLDYISVNQIMGQLASFGPVPAEQLIPWGCCTAIGFFFTMNQPLYVSVLVSAWLSVSWWLLTGKRSYQFTDRLVPLPRDYINANTLFVPATEPGAFRRKQQKNLPPIKIKTPTGKTESFMPFQKESNLHAIMEICLEDYKFAVILMCEKEDKWSATIPFALEGLHPELYREEVIEYSESIDEACKSIPPGEALTFLMGCQSDYSRRKEQLEQLEQQSSFDLIGLLLESEKFRGQQLTAKGKRQEWYHYAFCSWTRDRVALRQRDWLGWCIGRLFKLWSQSVRFLAGSQKAYWENLYAQLGREIYQDGFLPWQILLETRAGLKIAPLDAEATYQWLWYRFNTQPPPPIPQVIRVRETPEGLVAEIEQNEKKDLVSVLIQGERGNSRCPSVRDRETIWVNDRLVGAMTMEQRPSGWKNAREQLKWLWERLSEPHVRDTEAWVQISPSNAALVKDNLLRITKQSSNANKYALKDGFVKDVNATLKQGEALEAQRLIYEDKRPLYTALTLLLYRRKESDLDKACSLLANSFGTAKLVRDRRICWKLYAETLPFNTQRQLTSTALFSERRSHFDSSTVAGVLPLAKPKSLDEQGVEYLYHRGGFPILVDLFSRNLTALVTAKRGSGKSVKVFAYIKNAIARGIPVVGMDASLGGESTFKLITELLGERAAYVELTRKRFNVLQPPDLRRFSSQERKVRLNIWYDRLRQILVTMAMGNINDPALKERVEALVVKLLEVFFNDPYILDRYNDAFDRGWRSRRWKNMPTLHDLLSFCSREKLGLQNFEEIDRRAINQIVQQLSAKLIDPNIGDAIGAPSDFSPAPFVQIFSFSGLTNENNSVIMSLVAQMACINVGLAYPKSFMLMDECSVLLSKPGFAEATGENFATGRKFGQSIMLIGQDLESVRTCPAAAKILGNLDITLTGRTTSDATATYAEVLQIPKNIISKNATDAYLPNPQEYATRWLIGKDHRFWDCWYYAPPIELAALANQDDEIAARERFLKRHPHTNKGRIQALVEFTPHYIRALRGGMPLRDVVGEELPLQQVS